MTLVQPDWLDRLAMSSVSSARPEPTAISENADERFSRAHALKLAAGAAAALWFGRAGRATARPLETLTQCLGGCADKYARARSEDVDSCFRFFYGHGGISAPAEGIARVSILLGPDVARAFLATGCAQAREAHRSAQQSGCEQHCKDTCAASPQTCGPTTPPPAESPAVPPGPDPNSRTRLCSPGCAYCCPCGCVDPPYIPHGPYATQNCDVCKRNCEGSCD